MAKKKEEPPKRRRRKAKKKVGRLKMLGVALGTGALAGGSTFTERTLARAKFATQGEGPLAKMTPSGRVATFKATSGVVIATVGVLSAGKAPVFGTAMTAVGLARVIDAIAIAVENKLATRKQATGGAGTTEGTPIAAGGNPDGHGMNVDGVVADLFKDAARKAG